MLQNKYKYISKYTCFARWTLVVRWSLFYFEPSSPHRVNCEDPLHGVSREAS